VFKILLPPQCFCQHFFTPTYEYFPYKNSSKFYAILDEFSPKSPLYHHQTRHQLTLEIIPLFILYRSETGVLLMFLTLLELVLAAAQNNFFSNRFKLFREFRQSSSVTLWSNCRKHTQLKHDIP
jgi:hypothetical protein